MEKPLRYGDNKADLDVGSQRLAGASQLYDLDAVYIIREYDVFEKELRAGEQLYVGANDELDDDLRVLVALR